MIRTFFHALLPTSAAEFPNKFDLYLNEDEPSIEVLVFYSGTKKL